jgi:hypothetical protein
VGTASDRASLRDRAVVFALKDEPKSEILVL